MRSRLVRGLIRLAGIEKRLEGSADLSVFRGVGRIAGTQKSFDALSKPCIESRWNLALTVTSPRRLARARLSQHAVETRPPLVELLFHFLRLLDC